MNKIYNLETGVYTERELTEQELEEMRLRQEIQEKQSKIQALKNWFDITYTQLEQKFTRLSYLGKDYEKFDEFRNKLYLNLGDLYKEAELVRAEINELEQELLQY